MKSLIIAGLLLVFATMARAESITVFAASSLKTALDQIAAEWQEQGGETVVLVYDGSARLANQILQGAPADILASAAPRWMDLLEDSGALMPGTRRDLLGNDLVLIGSGNWSPVKIGAGLDLAAMLGQGRLAIGQIPGVPVGEYGKEALQSLGLWDQAATHLVEVETARAGLDLVARGEASLGIVFASDAVAGLSAGQAISVIGAFPASSHSAIVYPVALTESAQPGAEDFLHHLDSEAARGVFLSQGFKVLGP